MLKRCCCSFYYRITFEGNILKLLCSYVTVTVSFTWLTNENFPKLLCQKSFFVKKEKKLNSEKFDVTLSQHTNASFAIQCAAVKCNFPVFNGFITHFKQQTKNGYS